MGKQTNSSDATLQTVTVVSTESLDAEPKRKFNLPRAQQSRRMAKRIGQVREHITNAQNDVELGALLQARGLDETDLTHGLELQQAAAQTFDARQQAMGAQLDASETYAEAVQIARTHYGEFRSVGRMLFKKPARAGLGLVGAAPKNTEHFIAQARASYTAALERPEYGTPMVKYGYSTPRLTQLLAELDALFVPHSAANEAKSAALRATQERDQAVAKMDAWHVQYKTIARYATRGRADLRTRAGL